MTTEQSKAGMKREGLKGNEGAGGADRQMPQAATHFSLHAFKFKKSQVSAPENKMCVPFDQNEPNDIKNFCFRRLKIKTNIFNYFQKVSSLVFFLT